MMEVGSYCCSLVERPFPSVEDYLGLLPVLPLLRLWNRRDELGAPTAVQDLMRRLPLEVQLPVPLWALIGRIQDGVIEEWVGHCLSDTHRLPGQEVV